MSEYKHELWTILIVFVAIKAILALTGKVPFWSFKATVKNNDIPAGVTSAANKAIDGTAEFDPLSDDAIFLGR